MSKLKVAMAVMAAVMALSVSAVAFAQTPTPPATPTPSQSPLSAYNQTFWQTLADKLGTSVDKVQQAIRDALKAVVAQALKDGKLTQSQADTANSRIDQQQFNKPPFGPFGGEGHFGMGRGGFAGGAELNAAAAKLGMTVQDLVTELRGGKTLADVAKEKNISADDLKAAIITAISAQIDQAVTNGKLTQAQADQLKSNLNSQIDLTQPWPNRGGFKGFGHGFGFRGPRPATPQLGTPQ